MARGLPRQSRRWPSGPGRAKRAYSRRGLNRVVVIPPRCIDTRGVTRPGRETADPLTGKRGCTARRPGRLT